jgi:hypothetical protein
MFCPICNALACTSTPVVRPAPEGSKVYQICWCSTCDVRFDQRIASVNVQSDVDHQAHVNQDFYAQGFDEADYENRLEINRAMMQTMLARCSDRALFVEIGVGLGFLTRAVAPFFTRAIGLDLEVDTALSVGPVPENVEFHVHDRFLETFQGGISVLCAWHVVEHLTNPHQVLEPLFRRMVAGSLFVGQVPLYREDYVFDSHYVWYAEAALIRLVRAYGFFPIYLERDETNGFMSFTFRKQ